jgi:hypothetical protein
MKMRILAILLAGAIAYANPVLARSGGGKHDGHQGVEYANAGGAASEHMSQQGMENSNAQWSTYAARGQDRADWRNQNERGNGHRAGDGDHAGKGKHKGPHGDSDKGKKDKSNKEHNDHSNHSNHDNHSRHKGHGKGVDYQDRP